MQIIDTERYFRMKNQILNFIIENEYKYGEYAGKLVMKLLTDEVLEGRSRIPAPMSQILSSFGIYKVGSDEYQEMAKLLKKYSFLDGNCCEIGSGVYPRLAEETAREIKLRGGNLTIYEPNILFDRIKKLNKNVIINRGEFTKETNIDDIDTLFALSPCDATITIAEKAFEEDKNLMLAFCACDHSTPEHPRWVGEYWAEDFCMDYKEKYGKEVEIINWPKKVGIELPIMVRRSSKNLAKIKK